MAMKDAVNCENPRGAVSKLRSVGIRMGQPVSVNTETLGFRTRGRRAELKHLSKRRKRK